MIRPRAGSYSTVMPTCNGAPTLDLDSGKAVGFIALTFKRDVDAATVDLTVRVEVDVIVG